MHVNGATELWISTTTTIANKQNIREEEEKKNWPEIIVNAIEVNARAIQYPQRGVRVVRGATS